MAFLTLHDESFGVASLYVVWIVGKALTIVGNRLVIASPSLPRLLQGATGKHQCECKRSDHPHGETPLARAILRLP